MHVVELEMNEFNDDYDDVYLSFNDYVGLKGVCSFSRSGGGHVFSESEIGE